MQDGLVVLQREKERWSRVKHDYGLMDVQQILDSVGWRIGDVDLVVVNPYVRRGHTEHDRNGFGLTGHLYIDAPDYREPNLVADVKSRFSETTIRLLGRTIPAIAVDHHLAHAAASYYSSPFSEAAILTMDGGGDWRNSAIAHASGHRIEYLQYGVDRPGERRAGSEANVGKIWSEVGVRHFGFARLEAAGKLMGLSSYGRPSRALVAEFRQQAYTESFRAIPGVARRLDAHSDEAKAVAASLQAFTTEEMLRGARAAAATGSERLVLGGGCALNCIGNTEVHTSGLFAQTWVPAQPGDSGLALGQALFAWHHVLGNATSGDPGSPYLGHQALGLTDPGLIAEVAASLADGQLVAVCVDRAETGPRALGHRSILADPRRGEMRAVLNERVKLREWFRPFAPMLLEEDASNYLSPLVPSRHMSYISRIVAESLPAVTHVDGTCRPQLVGQDAGFPRAVLEEFKRQTGCGVLLNTLFNIQEPIVETSSQAFDTWRRSGIDALVAEGQLHRRNQEVRK